MPFRVGSPTSTKWRGTRPLLASPRLAQHFKTRAPESGADINRRAEKFVASPLPATHVPRPQGFSHWPAGKSLKSLAQIRAFNCGNLGKQLCKPCTAASLFGGVINSVEVSDGVGGTPPSNSRSLRGASRTRRLLALGYWVTRGRCWLTNQRYNSDQSAETASLKTRKYSYKSIGESRSR